MGFSMDFPCPGGQTRHPRIRCHGVGWSKTAIPKTRRTQRPRGIYTLWLFDVAMENPMDKWSFFHIFNGKKHL